jgi:hypothetical protein
VPAAAATTASTLPPGLQARFGAMTLRVTSVTLGDDTLTLGFVAVNAGDTPIVLNHADDLVVLDDAGGRYPLSPPPANPDVTLPARSRSHGLLVFSGRPPPGVETLTLVANSSFAGSAYTSHPLLRIEHIPVRP